MREKGWGCWCLCVRTTETESGGETVAEWTHHKLPFGCVATSLICMLYAWPVFHSNYTASSKITHKRTRSIIFFLWCYCCFFLVDEFHPTIERMPNYMLASQCAINFLSIWHVWIYVYACERVNLCQCVDFGLYSLAFNSPYIRTGLIQSNNSACKYFNICVREKRYIGFCSKSK